MSRNPRAPATKNISTTDTKKNVTTSRIQLDPPSTKSTVPGVDPKRLGTYTKPQPPRRSGGLKTTKPLPGSKLRPLQVNNREQDRSYTNTWDPINRPNVPLPKKHAVSVSATKATLNKPESNHNSESDLRQGDVSSTSRSSSVASTKPILPGIKQKSFNLSDTGAQTPNDVGMSSPATPVGSKAEDSKVSSRQSQRPLTSKKRDVDAAMNKMSNELKQPDESIDYYMPDWYRNPLVKPEQLKGGVTVLCCCDQLKIPEFDAVNIINIKQLRHLKDVKQFMIEQMNKSHITIAVFFPAEECEVTASPLLPPSLSKELALKANSMVKEILYKENVHDPQVYHLFSDTSSTVEQVVPLKDSIDFAGYCQEIADSLGIKSATTIEQIQSMIVKAQKRRVNILKQERAMHSNIYLETFESDDIWNHVYTCHSISEDCFKREDVLSQLKSTVRSAVDSNSSPVIISGGEKTGKTWLCAQLPTAIADEALTLVRFCGLTSLTSSLPKLLYGLSKQLSAIYHTPLLSCDVSQLSIADSFKLFKDLLDEVSRTTTKPVVLVLDGFDKLAASYVDLSHFISLFKNSVPNNVVLVVSLTSASDQSQFVSLQSDGNVNDLLKELADNGLKTTTDDMENASYDGLNLDDLLPIMKEKSKNGSSASFMEESKAKMKSLKQTCRSEDLSPSAFLATMKEVQEVRGSLIDHINSNIDPSVDLNVEEQQVFHYFMERCTTSAECREFVKTRIKTDMEHLAELNPADTKYLDTMEQGLESTESDQYRIRLCDLSADESRMFVRHLCKGKVEDTEAEVLEEIADQIHNPLLLRLLVNRCSLHVSAKSIADFFKMAPDNASQWLQTVYGDSSSSASAETTKDDDWCNEQSLYHIWVAYLVFTNEIIEKGAAAIKYSPPEDRKTLLPNLSFMQLNDAAKMEFYKSTDREGVIQCYMYYTDLVMDNCQLQIFEQGDYIRDIEQVETLIHSKFVLPNSLRTVPALAALTNPKPALNVLSKTVSDYFLELADASSDIVTVQTLYRYMLASLKGFESAALKLTDDDTYGEDLPSRYEMLLADAGAATHEADTWREVAVLSDDERVKELADEQLTRSLTERAAVTSAKEKFLPLARNKITSMKIVEILVLAQLSNLQDSATTTCGGLSGLLEYLLQYDILVPLLQEYGVDYVIDSYGRILELVTHSLELQKMQLQNFLPLEMLYNLLTSYTSQLRDNVASFHTLFLSMFNDDSSLSSRAALRLYRRVMHEVDLKNNLHLVTILPKIGDSSLLSTDAKRYLHNTSNKYAASQCISNKSYILSHNKNNLVKLWELTGEFISAQRLDGRIVCVCPQTTDGCFLALIETVSEVGQKFASVWRIDRLAHKKLADVGSRTILSAWFDKLGEKLVMVEQCTVDEMRVVVCVPQTMEVKVEGNAINILPYQPSNFMDKSLAIPHKVDETLLEIMKKHLAGDKPNPDPTELSFFTSLGDGGAKLRPIAVKQPLIFSSLQALWDDVLDKYDAKDDLVYPMQEIRSENLECREHLSKMAITLHGMTSAGDIVVDTQYSDGTHNVLLYKIDGSDIQLNGQQSMDEQATMTLMPTDDFVYSDTGSNSGLISWHLPTNNKKIFGNEQKVHVTCLQYEVEEGQILSFTRSQVTVWNAMKKTTESSFILDKASDIVSACLQDNWLAIANREGELSIRFEIRKKMATYHFHEPIDWIDCHVVKDHLYVACHVNGVKPSICFLKYRVSDAPLHEPGKYVVRPEKNVPA